MSLQVESIRLHNFRCYREAELTGLGSLVIFAGPNAVGKTNLVEGIQLLTALDSFRKPKSDQLIAWGQDAASLSAVFAGDQRQLQVGLTIDARGRRYRLNGKNRPRQELQGLLPAVVFSPDDLQLVKGAPDLRRAAIDALGEQVSRNYLSTKRDYDRLLRQKNRLLKDEVPPSYLASVNEVLVKIGGQLFRYRMHILKVLNEVFPDAHAETAAAGKATLQYTPSFAAGPLGGGDPARLEGSRAEVENLLHDAIARRSDEELRRKTSLVGPHRDKIEFLLDGRSAADFASQGQQRSIVIAYKLAELRLIERLTDAKPLLLLDDVMSELDAARRATLVTALFEVSQTFITTTNLDYFTPDLLARAQVFHLPIESVH